MAKRKTMTKAQKAMNAKIKKELQEKGIVPPDKPRLNRKKYIEEAREEWNGRDAVCMGCVPASGNQHHARTYGAAPASLS